MDIEQVREYALSLFGVTEDQPFGDDVVTFRVEGKIFLCLWLGGSRLGMKGRICGLHVNWLRRETRRCASNMRR